MVFEFQSIEKAQECRERIKLPLDSLELLVRALTHKSLSPNPQDPTTHNEVLEFLGDAVLELIISEALYKEFGSIAHEGDLTRYRSLLINAEALYQLAKAIGLGEYVFARDEKTGKVRFYKQLMADTFEAVVGALFVEKGYEITKGWVLETFEPLFQNLRTGRILTKDYRSTLQEYFQAECQQVPRYTVVEVEGPPHERVFTLVVQFKGVELGRGRGHSKKEAAQEAAKSALQALQNESLRARLGFRTPPPPGVVGEVAGSES